VLAQPPNEPSDHERGQQERDDLQAPSSKKSPAEAGLRLKKRELGGVTIGEQLTSTGPLQKAVYSYAQIATRQLSKIYTRFCWQ
jgi:hypothetical protein